MRIRRSWLLLVAVLIPSAARAHGHVADEYFAASFAFGSVLPGVHGSVSIPIGGLTPQTGSGVKVLALVGDVSFHDGSDDGRDVKQVNYLAGLRYTFARTPDQKRVPFFHVLIGGGHVKSFREWDADAALAIGGGFEYEWSERLGFRVQGDYIVRPGDINPRLSAGIVLRQ